MKAMAVVEFGGPEKLIPVDLPMPEPDAGEARIRVLAAAVNPTDILFREGSQASRLTGRPPPYVPGMEVAGILDKLGAGADDRLSVGDRVIALVLPASVHGGAYAEYAVARTGSIVTSLPGTSPAASATLLLNATTAWLALDALRLRPGQTVAITGAAGAVGSYAVEIAHSRGLRVLADAGSPADEAWVRSLGADDVVARGSAFIENVRAAHPGGVPGLVDGAHLDGGAIDAVAEGGSFATLRGWAPTASRGVKVHRISSTKEAENTVLFEELRRRALAGTLTLRVADVLPASRAADAHRRLSAGGVRGRLVLDFGAAAWG